MLVKNFNFDTAITTLIVEFPIKPINAAFSKMLSDHLFETVLFPRHDPQEYLYVGDEMSRFNNVAEVIRYQFGDLYNVEYACEEIAEQLQLQAEVWLEKMGGYENVKA
jgi:hypothetical protein